MVSKWIKAGGLVAGAVALIFFLMALLNPLPSSIQEFFNRISNNMHLLITSIVGLSVGFVL